MIDYKSEMPENYSALATNYYFFDFCISVYVEVVRKIGKDLNNTSVTGYLFFTEIGIFHENFLDVELARFFNNIFMDLIHF